MMQFPLQQFEQYIDEIILQRGFSYFRKGYVNPPEEISPGLYEAIVEGTEYYTVRLKLKNGTITEYACDCPYDFGPVCKHVAAVIFYLQQEELELQQKSPSQRKTNKKSKRKTVTQQVDELITSLSHDELKQFVKEQAVNDTSFRRVLLSTFAHLNKNESKAFYTQQVSAILKTAAGRDGFIDWQAVRYVGKAVSDLLETAQKHFNNRNYQSTLFIASAVLEEMTEALQFADDSSADIGSNIDIAYDLLADVASAELPEEIRKQLFDYTLTAYKKNIFSDWDWHLGMLEIAAMALSNGNEAEKVMALLDQVERKEFDFDFRQAQTIKLQTLKKIKGEKEAEKFMEQNLSNPSFRTEAIQKAMSKKDYEKAVSIAKDGVTHDGKDKPGLVMDWYDWLLKIALKQKDTKKIIEYARLIFVDSIRGKQPYYDILKTHVQKDSWNSFVEELVNDIKKKNRWLDFDVIANIYINEESWEKLLTILKQEFTKGSISLDYVKQYEKYLAKKYGEELVNLYEQGITILMQRNTGRSHYKNACRYIRRMIKLGAREKAANLIDKLRKLYPRRRALMDELENI